MNRTLQNIVTRFALAAMSIGLVAGPSMVAHAQSASLGTTISPPSFELTLSPGENVTKTIDIQNNSGTDQTYTLSTNGFTAVGEDGAATYSPEVSNDLSGWMTFSPADIITVPSNSAVKVDVTIAVPSDAAPGGHYATAFALTQSPNVQTTGVGVRQMFGVNFLVRVAGNLIENASVVEFSMPKARLAPGEEMTFNARVKNTGNVHIKPTGVVEIYRGSAKVDEVEINPTGGNILPNSIRRFAVKSTKYLPAGKYRAGLVLQYGASQVIQVPPVDFVVVNENLFVMVVIASLIILAIILIIALVVNRRNPAMQVVKKQK